MVIDSMDSFFVSLVVAVKLERLYSGVFIQQFRIVFDEPFCFTIAIEGNDMLLSQDERPD